MAENTSNPRRTYATLTSRDVKALQCMGWCPVTEAPTAERRKNLQRVQRRSEIVREIEDLGKDQKLLRPLPDFTYLLDISKSGQRFARLIPRREGEPKQSFLLFVPAQADFRGGNILNRLDSLNNDDVIVFSNRDPDRPRPDRELRPEREKLVPVTNTVNNEIFEFKIEASDLRDQLYRFRQKTDYATEDGADVPNTEPPGDMLLRVSLEPEADPLFGEVRLLAETNTRLGPSTPKRLEEKRRGIQIKIEKLTEKLEKLDKQIQKAEKDKGSGFEFNFGWGSLNSATLASYPTTKILLRELDRLKREKLRKYFGSIVPSSHLSALVGLYRSEDLPGPTDMTGLFYLDRENMSRLKDLLTALLGRYRGATASASRVRKALREFEEYRSGEKALGKNEAARFMLLLAPPKQQRTFSERLDTLWARYDTALEGDEDGGFYFFGEPVSVEVAGQIQTLLDTQLSRQIPGYIRDLTQLRGSPTTRTELAEARERGSAPRPKSKKSQSSSRAVRRSGLNRAKRRIEKLSSEIEREILESSSRTLAALTADADLSTSDNLKASITQYLNAVETALKLLQYKSKEEEASARLVDASALFLNGGCFEDIYLKVYSVVGFSVPPIKVTPSSSGEVLSEETLKAYEAYTQNADRQTEFDNIRNSYSRTYSLPEGDVSAKMEADYSYLREATKQEDTFLRITAVLSGFDNDGLEERARPYVEAGYGDLTEVMRQIVTSLAATEISRVPASLTEKHFRIARVDYYNSPQHVLPFWRVCTTRRTRGSQVTQQDPKLANTLDRLIVSASERGEAESRSTATEEAVRELISRTAAYFPWAPRGDEKRIATWRAQLKEFFDYSVRMFKSASSVPSIPTVVAGGSLPLTGGQLDYYVEASALKAFGTYRPDLAAALLNTPRFKLRKLPKVQKRWDSVFLDRFKDYLLTNKVFEEISATLSRGGVKQKLATPSALKRAKTRKSILSAIDEAELVFRKFYETYPSRTYSKELLSLFERLGLNLPAVPRVGFFLADQRLIGFIKKTFKLLVETQKKALRAKEARARKEALEGGNLAGYVEAQVRPDRESLATLVSAGDEFEREVYFETLRRGVLKRSGVTETKTGYTTNWLTKDDPWKLVLSSEQTQFNQRRETAEDNNRKPPNYRLTVHTASLSWLWVSQETNFKVFVENLAKPIENLCDRIGSFFRLLNSFSQDAKFSKLSAEDKKVLEQTLNTTGQIFAQPLCRQDIRKLENAALAGFYIDLFSLPSFRLYLEQLGPANFDLPVSPNDYLQDFAFYTLKSARDLETVGGITPAQIGYYSRLAKIRDEKQAELDKKKLKVTLCNDPQLLLYGKILDTLQRAETPAARSQLDRDLTGLIRRGLEIDLGKKEREKVAEQTRKLSNFWYTLPTRTVVAMVENLVGATAYAPDLFFIDVARAGVTMSRKEFLSFYYGGLEFALSDPLFVVRDLYLRQTAASEAGLSYNLYQVMEAYGLQLPRYDSSDQTHLTAYYYILLYFVVYWRIFTDLPTRRSEAVEAALWRLRFRGEGKDLRPVSNYLEAQVLSVEEGYSDQMEKKYGKPRAIKAKDTKLSAGAIPLELMALASNWTYLVRQRVTLPASNQTTIMIWANMTLGFLPGTPLGQTSTEFVESLIFKQEGEGEDRLQLDNLNTKEFDTQNGYLEVTLEP